MADVTDEFPAVVLDGAEFAGHDIKGPGEVVHLVRSPIRIGANGEIALAHRFGRLGHCG